jgi:hypothetical protein
MPETHQRVPDEGAGRPARCPEVSLLVILYLPPCGDQGTGAVLPYLDLNQACHFPGSVAVS